MANDQFTTTVPDIGSFTFSKRTMRQEMRIGAEYSRITEGIDTPTAWFELIAGIIAALKVLTVAAPDGWDIDDMDPSDDETYKQLILVNQHLQEQERSFRLSKKQAGKGGGALNGGDAGVLVSQEVQPAANGPTVS